MALGISPYVGTGAKVSRKETSVLAFWLDARWGWDGLGREPRERHTKVDSSRLAHGNSSGLLPVRMAKYLSVPRELRVTPEIFLQAMSFDSEK